MFNKPWLPFVIVIALGIVLFLVNRTQNDDSENPDTNKKQTTTTVKKTGEVDRNRGFDRRTSFLEYTEHGKCRMKCRKITQQEVEQIMRDGKINYNKSDVKDRPCPTYALEGVTTDNQRVRIVFAQCDYKTKVVTAIDLETDWSCECPGDDRKMQNQR